MRLRLLPGEMHRRRFTPPQAGIGKTSCEARKN